MFGPVERPNARTDQEAAAAGTSPETLRLLDALRIAAAKVVYRVGEWRPDLQQQALGEEAVTTDCGEALAELVRVAGVHRGPDGYPRVALDLPRVEQLREAKPNAPKASVPSATAPTPGNMADVLTIPATIGEQWITINTEVLPHIRGIRIDLRGAGAVSGGVTDEESDQALVIWETSSGLPKRRAMEAVLRDFLSGRGQPAGRAPSDEDAYLPDGLERFAFLPGDQDLPETLGKVASGWGCQWLVAIPADEVICPRCDGECPTDECDACCGTGVVSVERNTKPRRPRPSVGDAE